MAKEPKNIPTECGQRVVLRGRGHVGSVIKIDEKWIWVNWDESSVGNDGRAKIHHAYELTVQSPPEA
jgi:hypothetical protein